MTGASPSAMTAMLEGLGVSVEVAEGAKCDRCWKHSDDVGAVNEHPTLCRRCAEVVKSLG